MGRGHFREGTFVVVVVVVISPAPNWWQGRTNQAGLTSSLRQPLFPDTDPVIETVYSVVFAVETEVHGGKPLYCYSRSRSYSPFYRPIKDERLGEPSPP